MISKQEILDNAKQLQLSPNTIEKDYVIGWVLKGIASNIDFAKTWVFKGGTCLKKNYFNNYRFSEDLDFTLTDNSHIDSKLLNTSFHSIADFIYEHSGIQIPKQAITFEEYKNPKGKSQVEGKIGYIGPMQRQGSVARIKIDLTNNELIVLQPIKKAIYHNYSDASEQQCKILTYTLEEIFAEKIRALAERLRPRDLYDVINLYQKFRNQVDLKVLQDTLQQKCSFKNIAVPTMQSIEANPEKLELITEWQNMLAHQIKGLHNFEFYWKILPVFFNWLND